MRVFQLGLICLVLTACRGNTDDQIADLQAENDALSSELAALTETVDSLQTALDSQQDNVSSLNDEIDALTGLELSELLADVAEADARLTALEDIDIASEGWVTDQGFGLATDIAANTSRLDALDAQQAQQDTTIASNSALASANSTSLTEQALAIDGLTTSQSELTATIGTVQSTVSGNTQTIASNTTAITALQDADQTQQTALSDLTTRLDAAEEELGGSTEALSAVNERIDDVQEQLTVNVDMLTDDIDDVEADAQASRDVITAAVDDNDQRLTSVELELSDTFDVLADAIDDVDDKVLGGYPALFEYQGIGAAYDDRIAQGRSGLLLQTSGGGFSFSGWSGLNYTGGVGRVWTATWYIDNPSATPVSVDWTMCRGDAPNVLVDGVTVATGADIDGRCEDVNDLFTVPPGRHTVQIRYADSNNWLEGMGVTNPWMVEHGFTTDWDGLKAAMELGVDR